MLASLMACGALSVTVSRIARATPPTGFTRTILAGPIRLDETHVDTLYPDWKAKLHFQGESDMWLADIHIAPGGDTGWHSHPGPVFVSIVSGVATEYHADDCSQHIHLPGTGFLEPGGDEAAHDVRNEGSTDLHLYALFIVPAGSPTRIDQPAAPCF